MATKTLILDVDDLDDEHIESIRMLAVDIHNEREGFDGDIFKSTIQAVFEWLSLGLDEGEKH